MLAKIQTESVTIAKYTSFVKWTSYIFLAYSAFEILCLLAILIGLFVMGDDKEMKQALNKADIDIENIVISVFLEFLMYTVVIFQTLTALRFIKDKTPATGKKMLKTFTIFTLLFLGICFVKGIFDIDFIGDTIKKNMKEEG
jgi:hypothetical protein